VRARARVCPFSLQLASGVARTFRGRVPTSVAAPSPILRFPCTSVIRGLSSAVFLRLSPSPRQGPSASSCHGAVPRARLAPPRSAPGFPRHLVQLQAEYFEGVARPPSAGHGGRVGLMEPPPEGCCHEGVSGDCGMGQSGVECE